MKIPEHIHQRLFVLFTIMVVVTLPFSIRLNNFSIVLLALCWALEGGWAGKLETLKKEKFVWVMAGIFFLHVLALLYTRDTKLGLFEVEKKLPFLALPIIMLTSRSRHALKSRYIMNFFVGACFFAALFCLGNGLYQYSQGDSSQLYYHQLSMPLRFHAVYFSLYVGFSIFVLLDSLRSSWTEWTFLRRTAYIALVVFFSIFLVLLSSKLMTVVVFGALAVFIANEVRRKKGNAFSLFSAAALLAFLVAVVVFSPNIRSRFEEDLIDPYDQPNALLLDDYAGYDFSGINLRLAIWKTLVQEVNGARAWILGVGPGDAQDVLTRAYERKHFYPGDEEQGFEGFLHYNGHNQFLQFYIMLGAAGVVLFVTALVFIFRDAIRSAQFLALAFLFLFSAFSLTESTLQVQKGIVFFTLFSSCFALFRQQLADGKNHSE